MMEIEIMHSMDKKKDGKYDEYEIKSCADTLLRAEEIKANPEKMKLVKKELMKRKKAIMSIDDIREAHQKMGKEESEEEDED